MTHSTLARVRARFDGRAQRALDQAAGRDRPSPRTPAQQALAQEMDACLDRWAGAHDPVQVAAMLAARLGRLAPLNPARARADAVFQLIQTETSDAVLPPQGGRWAGGSEGGLAPTCAEQALHSSLAPRGRGTARRVVEGASTIQTVGDLPVESAARAPSTATRSPSLASEGGEGVRSSDLRAAPHLRLRPTFPLKGEGPASAQ